MGWYSLPASKSGKKHEAAEATTEFETKGPVAAEPEAKSQEMPEDGSVMTEVGKPEHKTEPDNLVDQLCWGSRKAQIGKKAKWGKGKGAHYVDPEPDGVLHIETTIERYSTQLPGGSPVEDKGSAEDETDAWRFWGAKKSPRPSI